MGSTEGRYSPQGGSCGAAHADLHRACHNQQRSPGATIHASSNSRSSSTAVTQRPGSNQDQSDPEVGTALAAFRAAAAHLRMQVCAKRDVASLRAAPGSTVLPLEEPSPPAAAGAAAPAAAAAAAVAAALAGGGK